MKSRYLSHPNRNRVCCRWPWVPSRGAFCGTFLAPRPQRRVLLRNVQRRWCRMFARCEPSVRKTASFLVLSLCLSRACLDKMIVFIYKWLKNAVFRSLAEWRGRLRPQRVLRLQRGEALASRRGRDSGDGSSRCAAAACAASPTATDPARASHRRTRGTGARPGRRPRHGVAHR
jgi:hypothetical protein